MEFSKVRRSKILSANFRSIVSPLNIQVLISSGSKAGNPSARGLKKIVGAML